MHIKVVIGRSTVRLLVKEKQRQSIVDHLRVVITVRVFPSRRLRECSRAGFIRETCQPKFSARERAALRSPRILGSVVLFAAAYLALRALRAYGARPDASGTRA